MLNVYDLLGPDGYAALYPDHLASGATDVREWRERLCVLEGPLCGRLLDIGCGLGERTEAWATHGYDVLGIDESRVFIAAARQRFPQRTFLEFDARESVRLGVFDVVVAHFNFFMMLPLDDVREFLKKLRSVVRPGGVFLTDVSLPCGEVPEFRECWSLNDGRNLIEVGSRFLDGYRHEWFAEDGTPLCEENFWFRTREAYQVLARSSGWSVCIQDWKADETRTYDLMIFQ